MRYHKNEELDKEWIWKWSRVWKWGEIRVMGYDFGVGCIEGG